MNGQVLFRLTGVKTKSGKDAYIIIGVVSLDESDSYKDGHKYDVLDIIARNGEDFTELNNYKSPEDLLSEKIWVVK